MEGEEQMDPHRTHRHCHHGFKTEAIVEADGIWIQVYPSKDCKLCPEGMLIRYTDVCLDRHAPGPLW